MNGNVYSFVSKFTLFFLVVTFCVTGLYSNEQQIKNEQEKKLSGFAIFLKGFTYNVPEGVESEGWKVLGNITLPLIKITDSDKEDVKLKGSILTSTGFGASICYLKDGDGDLYRSFSFTPMVLVSGEMNEEGVQLDISFGMTIGLLDDHLMVGFGWDAGKINDRKSRFFGLIGARINFANKR